LSRRLHCCFHFPIAFNFVATNIFRGRFAHLAMAQRRITLA
jgi:hypothetical protein